ncbi:restriction endonuclease subunit S [Falsiroseomonas sp.]|uniref:restriction endonuclease subunit S n=1 Tax=Falsiroseomonas sp. TaxID=2870721 RepID=UPI003569B7A2
MDALPSEGLPPGWTIAKLGDLGVWTGGGTPSKSRDDFWTGGTVPWVSPKDMKAARVGEGAERITEAAVAQSAAKLVPAGSVLCVVRSGILQHTFPVAIADQDVTLNQDMRALTPARGIAAEYLRHYLRYRNDDILHSCSKDGTTVASIEQPRLHDFSVPLAPEAEQTRIVAAVNALFEEVEAGEAALARAREGLTQFRASLLHAACAGALTADWRAANPTNETGHDLLADVLAKRRIKWAEGYRAAAEARGRRLDGEAWMARYPQPQPVTGDDLESLPQGWAWASLDQLCVTMTSGSRAWAPYYDRGASVFVMAQNVRPGRFDRSFVQLVDPPQDDPERIRTRIQRDDLLVTIVGANTGDVCRVDADIVDHYVCQSVALMRPVRADLAEYLDLFLNSERGGQAAFARMMYGAGRPHLSFDQLKSVAVPLPPSAEIAAILLAVREAWIESDALMADVFAASLRQSILHAAFTGRLAPQDPADEPAAALLARLRATPAASRRPRARRNATQPDLIETPA